MHGFMSGLGLAWPLHHAVRSDNFGSRKHSSRGPILGCCRKRPLETPHPPFCMADYGTCLQEMHVDGFRFDLGSIMTRAHSQWHRTSASDNGKPVGLLSGGKVQGVQGELPSMH